MSDTTKVGKVFNLTGSGSSTTTPEMQAHMENTEIHVTAAEKTDWNGKPGKVLAGQTVEPELNIPAPAQPGAEIFNDYREREYTTEGAVLAGNVAYGAFSHAEGQETTVIGDHAHAEGYQSLAKGYDSHAEGRKTIAEGDSSHAEGDRVQAISPASHAEGRETIAEGEVSHAEGSGTIAKGPISHAEGDGTIAASPCQHVQGRFNIEDDGGKYAYIVGNGTDPDNRSNAYTLDWEGNAWFAGSVDVNDNKILSVAAPDYATDAANKRYVDDTVGALTPATIGAAAASHNHYLGSNPIATVANDTVTKWAELGTGYAFFSTAGLITDQPSQYGMLVNFATGTEIFQIWKTMASGPMWCRSGNASGWNQTWNKIYSTNSKPTAAEIGAAATNHNHSAANITSGQLALARGGTGQTTAAGALYALINGSGALANTGLATNDIVALGDVSAGTGKKVTLANLATYLAAQSGGAKIATGSYTGTGTYGASNPCSLTFDFVPKYIRILGYSVNGSHHENFSEEWGSRTVRYSVMCSLVVSNTYNTQYYLGQKAYTDSWSYSGGGKLAGKTYTWYNTAKLNEVGANLDADTSADAQFNSSGTTYHYLAIG